MIDKLITEIQAVITPILKEYEATRAGLFGSVVRGEMGSESDIDVLVELPNNKSLLTFVGLKLDLEEALGRPVDLVEYSTIHPLLQETILSEEVSLMKRDNRLFVRDIMDSILKIEDYTRGLSQKDFSKDDLTQDAVVRRLEIIGEATKNLPRDFRLKYPDIPWKKMASMRDVLIHVYFRVNVQRVWKVIEEDLVELKRQIKHILDES